jgi:diguanylate cyclase (GGDEF)-like protein
MDNGNGTRSAIADQIGHLKRLPTLPGIALRILEAVQREEPDLGEIAEILSTDPPLSAEVLKIVNSSYFGLPKKITTVLHAVNMLGIQTVKNLALSFALIKSFRNQGEVCLDYSLFWKNSLTVAVAAKLIAEKVAPEMAEDAFFLGLLHELGVLAMAQCMPDQYAMVLKEAEVANCTLLEVENQIIGFSHMDVGAYLMESWGLPKIFYLPIANHHHPEKIPLELGKITVSTRILHLACLFIGVNDARDRRLGLKLIDLHTELYGFDQQVKPEEIAVAIDEATGDIFPFFEFSDLNSDSYLEIVESAREELIQLSNDFANQLLEKQREIEQLKHQVYEDSLTRLSNYHHFQDLLDQEIYRCRRYHSPLALIFSDIDRFRSINETYGQQAGDQTLITVAALFRKVLRTSDQIARYGGEEFAFILPETDLNGALMVAERLRKVLEVMEITWKKKRFSITMSFGVASVSDGEANRLELLRRADEALQKAKAQGRNRCCS